MIKEDGFSLIELAVSLFAASLLITLIMQQFLICKRQFIQMQGRLQHLTEIEELSNFIRGSIRRAGFTPCGGISSLQTIDKRLGKRGLVAVENVTGLKINRMDEHFALLIKQVNPTQILVKTDEPFDKEKPIIVADCYHAEVQKISQARKTTAGTLLSLSQPLEFQYEAPVYIGEWIEESFFIKKNNQGENALFYEQNHVDELSSLVDNLSIELNTFKNKTIVEADLGAKLSQKIKIITEIRAG
ncbi:MAG: hypothetical protein H0U57_03990 [Tatlockia sp.]|nr:hypothetical protein [Tatlockia sp.]